jgi:hypothetical protein
MPSTHTAQLVCCEDSAHVMSDIIENIDPIAAKLGAESNYKAKYDNDQNWQSRWKTFQELLAVSTYRTS